jgi:hypothetical protein
VIFKSAAIFQQGAHKGVRKLAPNHIACLKVQKYEVSRSVAGDFHSNKFFCDDNTQDAMKFFTMSHSSSHSYHRILA